MAEVEQTGPLSKPCPACGVQVPPGYVKCPRCHAELPQTTPGRKRPATDVGGGTTVAPGMDRTLIYIGVGAIALIALVTFLLTRGGDSGSSRNAAAPVSGTDEPVVDDDTTTGGGGETEAPPDRPAQPVQPVQPAPGVSPGVAIAELGAALRGERLWASVTADGSVVVIQSSFCEDAGLTSIVDGHSRDLRDARFTAIRCRAPHGETVFEREL